MRREREADSSSACGTEIKNAHSYMAHTDHVMVTVSYVAALWAGCRCVECFGTPRDTSNGVQWLRACSDTPSGISVCQ
jgi:hypothetical protein